MASSDKAPTPPPVTPPPVTPPPVTPPPVTPPPVTPPPVTPPPVQIRVSIPSKYITPIVVVFIFVGIAAASFFSLQPKKIEYAKSTPAPVSTPTPTPEPTPNPTPQSTPIQPVSIATPAPVADNSPNLEAIYTNSLGQRFVKVPNTVTYFSIWDTRVSDYSAFASHSGRSWKQAGFPQGQDHPAVRISYNDAVAFCNWLTQFEHESGKLPQNLEYRLPSDLEWSVAAGINELELEGVPKWRADGIPNCYGWGSSFPPPFGFGNFDPKLKADSYPFTSPVGIFPANQNGLFDISGNVQQWVLDDYDESGQGVLRGSSWADEDTDAMNLTARCNENKDTTYKVFGFRCVIAPINTCSKVPTKQIDPNMSSSSSSGSPTNQSNQQVPDGASDFFKKWMNDHASNNPNDVANDFSNGAFYCYANGPTSRQFIYDDFLKLNKKYPFRSFNNILVDSVNVQAPDVVSIKYHFNYLYRGQKVASGSSSVEITIQNFNGQWLVTSFSESVNRH